jgi:hypothetical protein
MTGGVKEEISVGETPGGSALLASPRHEMHLGPTPKEEDLCAPAAAPSSDSLWPSP